MSENTHDPTTAIREASKRISDEVVATLDLYVLEHGPLLIERDEQGYKFVATQTAPVWRHVWPGLDGAVMWQCDAADAAGGGATPAQQRHVPGCPCTPCRVEWPDAAGGGEQ